MTHITRRPSLSRRNFVAAGLAAAAIVSTAPSRATSTLPAVSNSPLAPMTGAVKAIDVTERLARIAKVQAALRAEHLSALLIETGPTLLYFTGIDWSRSERLTCALIPAQGEPCIVTPYFEEPSTHPMLAIPSEVRTWQEDDNPLAVVADWLKQKKAVQAIGIEETTRYFIVEGLAKALPHAQIRSAADAVRSCRMVKSSAEIALMQLATYITLAAYRYTVKQIRRGMMPEDISAIMHRATLELGGVPEFEMALCGEASANPHGSHAPQVVRDGEIILMDCGCTVEGYNSDVSRTFVFGEPTTRHREVWNQVHRGQEIGFTAAALGATAGSVDDAVRSYYETLGYGPKYRRPGLPHRTGHGIGLSGHEPAYLVHGDPTPLARGMCFSDEPGLYIPGSFGVRIEDCFHMTESGPKWFSTPPKRIDDPI